MVQASLKNIKECSKVAYRLHHQRVGERNVRILSDGIKKSASGDNWNPGRSPRGGSKCINDVAFNDECHEAIEVTSGLVAPELAEAVGRYSDLDACY